MTRPLLLSSLCIAVLGAADTPVTLMDQGHHKRLRTIAEQRYREHPNDPEALWMMSFVKLTWHDHKAALELAEKAVAADPKNPRYRMQLAQAVGQEAQKASILRQPGLARRFKKELEAVLALDPNNVEAMKLLILYDFEAPGIMGGDKAEGRATVTRIAHADPAEGYLAQVTIARYDGQKDRFEELLKKAVEAGPASYPARIALANFYLGSKKFHDAEGMAREALRIDATRASAHAILAVSLAWQERWPELDTALADAERAVPDDFSPYFRAALSCLERSMELPRAERYCRKYLTQEPEPYTSSHARAHWRLGQVLEKEGRKAEAISEFQASVKLDAESPAKQDLKRIK